MSRTRLATLAASFATAVGLLLTMATPAQAATVNYVALGDSYSSGVGAGSYTSESGSCKRSNNAYSAIWARTYAPTSYRSVACSGATTANVINSQVSALSSSTTLVSITIGGNDMGFSNIMSVCVLESTTNCLNAIAAAKQRALTVLPGLLDNTYNAIRSRAPSARVVVLNYPRFYYLDNPFCFGLAPQSRAAINDGVNTISDVTRAAVSRHSGFVFGDVRSIWGGHELCGPSSNWLHSLSLTNFSDSYHPNSAGQSGGYYPIFRNNTGVSLAVATTKRTAKSATAH